mmetsp:Transcript_1698/g.3185  ORF Transcript_1698/g.3185 Transcript_1698/m.3185 type:complete len:244 (+) Transcript_1698:222-953(+)
MAPAPRTRTLLHKEPKASTTPGPCAARSSGGCDCVRTLVAELCPPAARAVRRRRSMARSASAVRSSSSTEVFRALDRRTSAMPAASPWDLSRSARCRSSSATTMKSQKPKRWPSAKSKSQSCVQLSRVKPARVQKAEPSLAEGKAARPWAASSSAMAGSWARSSTWHRLALEAVAAAAAAPPAPPPSWQSSARPPLTSVRSCARLQKASASAISTASGPASAGSSAKSSSAATSAEPRTCLAR